MFRLLKYLRPFTALIIISIVFLFLQAIANLALPDYLSDIVNVGIQQGGVEDAVAEAVSKSRMDRLLVFMDEEEKAEVLENYTLKAVTSSDFREYLDKYPRLMEEGVYVLNKITREKANSMNKILSRAFVAVGGIEVIISDPERAGESGIAPGLDLSRIPEGMSAGQVIEMIEDLPDEQKSMILENMEQQFQEMGDTLLTQMAVNFVRAEYGYLGLDTARVQRNYIWQTGGVMLLLTLLSAVSTIAVGYFAARTGAGLAKNLRGMTFSRVEGFSNAEFDRFSTASLITRSTNDITQIQMLVIMMIRMVFYAPLLGIGGIVLALRSSVSMSWIIAVAVISIISLIMVVFSITLPRFRRMQDLIDRLNLVIRESLSGIMVIRAFNNQHFQEKRFDRANLDLTSTSLFVTRAMVVLFPAMMLAMNGVSLMIVWVGANQVAVSNIQVGDMMAFLQYAMLIIMAFLMLSVMFIMFPRASVSAGRVADVLDTQATIKDPEKPEVIQPGIKGQIEFKDVSFRYPNAEEDVIHDVSFRVRRGETTAVIGSTGSGKSTLASLILRFYDVSQGKILVDGKDVREIRQKDLRERIGYVPQQSVLFSGTIGSNLRYADDDAAEARLEEAASVAQALDFIKEKSDGFDSSIAQGGKNVSGGQGQRLSIARALVKDPEILVLDDCFSALDFRTDRALRHALREYASDTTLFIIAQRVGTVMSAEQIIVLDEGRIAGMGTHEELMADCETYREIAFSQLSREELA
jgi:ATP-binding cassette, subfamily B, multidrug efflux pump